MKIKALLYCTKGKLSLRKSIKDKDYYLDNGSEFNIIPKEDYKLNGKIVIECDFEVEDLRIVDDDPLGSYWYETKTLSENEVLEKSCLTSDELYEYLGEDNEGYEINLKNLNIFNKPKNLDEVYYKSIYSWGITYEIGYHRMHRAPKNIRYVYDKEGKEKKIIIPVSPQEMCRIANKEQTALVRKKVLKEMK